MAITKTTAGSSDNDLYSSGDENAPANKPFALKSTKKTNAVFDKFGDDGDEDNSSEDNNGQSDGESDDDNDDTNINNAPVTVKKTAQSFIDKAVENDDDDDDDDQYFGFLSGDEEEALNTADGEGEGKSRDVEETAKFLEKSITSSTTFGTQKIKKLTPKQLEKEEKRIKRTGVVYMSSLPPYMKPQKIRQIMGRFGEVGRIFLKPEDPKVYKSRIKSGGNKKKKFEEGWVEFSSKNDAKLAATTLNGNILGGKKRSFYHDDVMNVKYLKGFKWFDLTNALNREVEVRDSKKQAELSQAHKLNKAYIKNVETSKTINRVRESRKRKADEDGDDKTSENADKGIRRNFKQRNVATNRAGADDSIKNKSDSNGLDSVLNKIF